MIIESQQSRYHPTFWRLTYNDKHWRAQTSQFSTDFDLPAELAWRLNVCIASQSGKGPKPSEETKRRIILLLQAEIDSIFKKVREGL